MHGIAGPSPSRCVSQILPDVRAVNEPRNQSIADEVVKQIKDGLGPDNCSANQKDVLDRVCRIFSGESWPGVSLAVVVNGQITSQEERTVAVKLKPAKGDWGKCTLSREGRHLLNSNRINLLKSLGDNPGLFNGLIDECQTQKILNENDVKALQRCSTQKDKIKKFLDDLLKRGTDNAGMVIEFFQTWKMLSSEPTV